MKIRKGVILAAGFGTRFLPQTKAVPKEMLERNNKRFATLMGMNVKHIVPDGEEYADYGEVLAGAAISRSQYA